MANIIRKKELPPIERIDFNSASGNTYNIHRNADDTQNYIIDLNNKRSVAITLEDLDDLTCSLRILVDEDKNRRDC